MTYEDESFPTVICRPVFDTERCPPPSLPFPASPPVTLAFPGGAVALPQPTRADLVLSAQQWATAIREHMVDWNCLDSRARGYFDRLDAVLKELAES
jgi:hypothetical protein